jgi:hypothetical protein
MKDGVVRQIAAARDIRSPRTCTWRASGLSQCPPLDIEREEAIASC